MYNKVFWFELILEARAEIQTMTPKSPFEINWTLTKKKSPHSLSKCEFSLFIYFIDTTTSVSEFLKYEENEKKNTFRFLYKGTKQSTENFT